MEPSKERIVRITVSRPMKTVKCVVTKIQDQRFKLISASDDVIKILA